MSDPITVPFRCEALIDQGRTIGDDPVGHACFREATLTVKDANGLHRYLCGECAIALRTQIGAIAARVTLPPASEEQGVIAARIFVQLLEDVAFATYRHDHRDQLFMCDCAYGRGQYYHDKGCSCAVSEAAMREAWRAEYQGGLP
jgi:hypothetical protein